MHCFDGVRRISGYTHHNPHGEALTLLVEPMQSFYVLRSNSFAGIFPHLGWDALPPSEGKVPWEESWDLV